MTSDSKELWQWKGRIPNFQGLFGKAILGGPVQGEIRKQEAYITPQPFATQQPKGWEDFHTAEGKQSVSPTVKYSMSGKGPQSLTSAWFIFFQVNTEDKTYENKVMMGV